MITIIIIAFNVTDIFHICQDFFKEATERCFCTTFFTLAKGQTVPV